MIWTEPKEERTWLSYDRYAAQWLPSHVAARVDEGLRSYMLSVYNYMAAGVALTGVTAYLHQHDRRRAVARPASSRRSAWRSTSRR